jgi:spore maturation protein CgeB
MRFVYFTHSLASCWNHGNAHFVRGVIRELIVAGHDVAVYEPEDSWSLGNLLADAGENALAAYRVAYPELTSQTYTRDLDLARATAGADVVIVHEWNEEWLVAALGRMRREQSTFQLLFHDTHHRAVSDPAAMQAYDLDGYDGVLAFGDVLADVYRKWGWGDRVFTWHEAADIRHFHPPAHELPRPAAREGIVWIGNWGDGERSAELQHFLFEPVQAAGLPLDIYGVRYPAEALAMIGAAGAQYRGFLPNARAPEVFARHLATVHVPRRFYVTALPGIPTIRVFEALACGIPLVCSPWEDREHLFRPGADYLVARDGAEMARHLRALAHDRALRCELAASGLATIRSRHTCAHRVTELLSIVARLKGARELERVA